MSAPASTPAFPEDADLLARLRRGDADAYETLVRRQMPIMLAVARRILRNEEEARDAVQDAFHNAFRGLASFEEGSRLSTWLHRITVNAALMRLRSLKRHPEEPLDELLPAFTDDGHQVQRSIPWQEPSELPLESAERSRIVRDAIDRLPETHRTILLLRDIEGLDTAETAARLEVSENAVKLRLHRARQALRSLLEPHFGVKKS